MIEKYGLQHKNIFIDVLICYPQKYNEDVQGHLCF